MKKIMVIVALVVASLMAFVACTPAAAPAETPTETAAAPADAEEMPAAEESADAAVPEATGDIKLAYICKVLDNAWFQGTTAAFEAKAKELGATEVLLLDSKMDPETCLSQVDSVIQQGINGVAINLPDENMSRAVADKFNAAGIPFIAQDDPFVENGEYIAPAYMLDAYLSGWQTGEWMGQYVMENNLMDSIDEMMFINLAALQIESFVKRTDGAVEGFQAACPDFPADKMLTIDTKDALEEGGYNAMASQIAAHPEIKIWIVTGVNDETAIGGVRALEAAGLSGTSYVGGAGAYLAKDEWKKDETCLVMSNFIDPNVDGNTAAEELIKSIQNGTVPFDEVKEPGQEFGIGYLTPIVCTPADYEEIMGDAAK